MKQFILKNIVLVVILALTFIGSIVLIFMIVGKRGTISQSMSQIDEDVNKLVEINNLENPRRVRINQERITSDKEKMDKKTEEVYRHFGRPYRPALHQFLANINSSTELKTDLPLDKTLLEPAPKTESEAEAAEQTGEEIAEAETPAPAEPEAGPTEEEKEAEKKVFDPKNKRVILAYNGDNPNEIRVFDEDKLHEMLAEIYKAEHEHADSSSEDASDEGYTIPENIREERAIMFGKLFNEMIEPPDVVTSANKEAFRLAAAEKFAHAFAIFRRDVQALTQENVTDEVAYEIFLDAVGIPREMRQDTCRSYLETITRKYLASDLIPGLPADDPTEKQRLVQKFIYGTLDPRMMPPADKVIPIIRNIQIKEDLFRRLKDSGIASLDSMTVPALSGSPLETDAQSRLLMYTYELELTASMEAIDAFINSLHQAYDSGRVYFLVTNGFKLSTTDDELKEANAIVAGHLEEKAAPKTTARNTATAGNLPPGTVVAPGANAAADPQAQAAQVQTVTTVRNDYPLTDPHNSDYAKVLLGGTQDEIKCSLVVQYLYDSHGDITTNP